VHFANEQNNILIKWSLVVNFFMYLSELLDFTEDSMNLLSIKEISCPKTEVPKKCVFLSIVEFFFVEANLLKKEKGRLTSSFS
jgi:hypothetical protein